MMILAAFLFCAQADFKFETASIRPSAAQDNSSGFHTTQGGLRTNNTSLLMLMQYAYGAHPYQVIGASGWMSDARFDIVARIEESEADADRNRSSQKDSGERMRARMRNLLAERFQLRIREENRELPVYALQIDKAHKLKPAQAANGSTNTNRSNGSGRMVATGMTMRSLAEVLSGILGRTAINETGLGDSAFDVELNWSDAASGDGPSIFTALKEQLGLRLDSKKGPVPVYVIEKAEKPSDN